MPEIKQGLNLGDLLKYEAPNLYSRDRITVAAGQTLALGTVLGEVTASGELTALDPRRRGRQRRRRGRPLLQACRRRREIGANWPRTDWTA